MEGKSRRLRGLHGAGWPQVYQAFLAGPGWAKYPLSLSRFTAFFQIQGDYKQLETPFHAMVRMGQCGGSFRGTGCRKSLNRFELGDVLTPLLDYEYGFDVGIGWYGGRGQLFHCHLRNAECRVTRKKLYQLIVFGTALFWIGSLPFLSTPWFNVLFFPFVMQAGLLEVFSEKYAEVSSVAKGIHWLASFSNMSLFKLPEISAGWFMVCVGGTIMAGKLSDHFFQRVGFDLPLAIAALAAIVWVGVVYRLLDWGLTLES